MATTHLGNNERRNLKWIASFTAPLLDEWNTSTDTDSPSLHHYRKRPSPWIKSYHDLYASAWEAAASMHESSAYRLQRQMEHLTHQVHTDMQSLHDRLDNVLANANDDVKAQAQTPSEDLLCLGSSPQQPALLPSWVQVQPPVEHVSVDEFQRQLGEFSNDQTNQLVEQLALHDAKWMGVLDQFEKKLLQSLAIKTHEPLSPKSTVIGVINQADIYETESEHFGAADEGKSVEHDDWDDEDCPECNHNVDDEWQML